MDRQRIRQMLLNFSREIDSSVLGDFTTAMEGRLNSKRAQGRTGWELMKKEELADLICKVLDKHSSNMYTDLANLCMFCHALEIEPEFIVNGVGAHLYGVRRQEIRRNELMKQKADLVKDNPSEELPEEIASKNSGNLSEKLLEEITFLPEPESLQPNDGDNFSEEALQNLAEELSQEIPSKNLGNSPEESQQEITAKNLGNSSEELCEEITDASTSDSSEELSDEQPMFAEAIEELYSGHEIAEPSQPEDGKYYTLKLGDMGMLNVYQYKAKKNLFIPVNSHGNKMTSVSVVSNRRADVEWEETTLEEELQCSDVNCNVVGCKNNKVEPESDENELIAGRTYQLRMGNAPMFNLYRYFAETERFRELSDKGNVMLEGKAFDAHEEGLTWELYKEA